MYYGIFFQNFRKNKKFVTKIYNVNYCNDFSRNPKVFKICAVIKNISKFVIRINNERRYSMAELDIAAIIGLYLQKADAAEGGVKNERFDRNNLAEVTVFTNLLKEDTQLTAKQKDSVAQCFGLDLSDNARLNAPKRAPENGNTYEVGDGETVVVDGNENNTYQIGDGGTVIINNKWEIVIVVQNDTKELIQELIKAFNDATVNMELKLEQYFNGSLDRLLEFAKGLFQEYVVNNNMNFEQLYKIIEELSKQITHIEEQNDNLSNQIVELNRTVKEQTLKLIENMSGLFAQLGVDLKGIREAVENNGEKLDDQVKWLQKIYTELNTFAGSFYNYTVEQRKQYNAVIGLLKQNNASLAEIYALLKIMRVENKENSEAIVNAVVEGNKEILEVLHNFEAKFGDFDERVSDMLLKIFNKKLVVDGEIVVNVDTSKLEGYMEDIKQILSSIKGDTAEINQKQDKLITLVDKYGIEITGGLNKVIGNQEKQNEKLDKIISLMDKYGEKFNAILEHMDKSDENFDTKMEALFNLMLKLDENDEQRNKQVLDAINKLGGQINNLDVDMINSFNKIYDKIDQLPNAKDYTELLQKILDKLGTLDDLDETLQGGISAILKAIADNAVDFTELYKLIKENHGDLTKWLDKIFKAIQDHDVNVTVDVTGQVYCECGQDGGANEGIIGTLTKGLKIKRKDVGTDNVPQLPTGGYIKDGKYLHGNKIVIVTDGHVYDTDGKLYKATRY